MSFSRRSQGGGVLRGQRPFAKADGFWRKDMNHDAILALEATSDPIQVAATISRPGSPREDFKCSTPAPSVLPRTFVCEPHIEIAKRPFWQAAISD
jgi:hypothetical protein